MGKITKGDKTKSKRKDRQNLKMHLLQKSSQKNESQKK